MQGPIAQIIALTIYGNSFIQGFTSDIGPFFPENSTFTFCEYVKFVDIDNKEEKLYAKSPVDWFEKLKKEGVFAFRLVYGPSGDKDISDRMSVGFVGGGGRWLIETISPNGSDYWEARWEVGNQNHPKKLIWQVTYGRIASGEKTLIYENLDGSKIKAELSSNLVEISKFARSHDLEGFANAFDKGLSALNSDKPYSDVYHKDISPDNFLDLEATQLIAASQAAWVFGGMGSWNDLGFDGKEQDVYEKLSDDLYRLLNDSYLMAANSNLNIDQELIKITGAKWWEFWK
ncbi:MAG: hypothetical protein HUN04_16485 [Desulfobacter sp.]|nr:MAG: hypothetical protein HUN04_16485 [Desulfobacter sp.]